MATSEKQFVFNDVIRNVRSIREEEGEDGDEKKHFNMKWKIMVVNYDDFYGLGIRCDPESEKCEEWSVDTEFEIALIGKQVLTTKGFYCHKKYDRSCFEMMTVKDSQIDKYLINGNLTVKCHVKILKAEGVNGMKSKFDGESMRKYSDVVLFVDGEKFYVSKTFLASRSPYFDTLLMGQFKESNQSEVVLHGIEVDDFQNFLEILYAEAKLTDENVESVLRVADMYETKCVLKRAEEFLLEVSMKSKKEKFELAVKYNLEQLKESIISECDNAEEIRCLLPEDLNQLDKGTMAELFQKFLSATTTSSPPSKRLRKK